MDWTKEIEGMLHQNMTETGFDFWSKLNEKIPSTWDKPTSSTGKYHKKHGTGEIPTCGEHVATMLFTATKMLRMFSINPKTADADMLLMAVALHDSYKYGESGETKHTMRNHDKVIADKIVDKKAWFLHILNEGQCDTLQEAVRFHSGQWSTDADKDFDFNNIGKYAQFVHTLDMLEAANLLKYHPGEDNG